MSNKQIMQKVFSEKWTANEMRNKILAKKIKEEKTKKFVRCAIPIGMIGIICGLFMWNNNLVKLESNPKSYEMNQDSIIINQVDKLGAKRLDAKTKEISANGIYTSWPDNLTNVIVPKDLIEFDSYGIYTRENKTNDYTILNCYVYDYFNPSTQKSIRIAFSKNNKPLRDYWFSEEGARESNINGYKLTIYQYEHTYFTTFEYKDYNFDIETNEISLEELLELLKSITK